MESPLRRTDWVLMLEVGLVFALIGAGVAFYWYPITETVLTPRWWHGAILVGLFFVLVWIDSRRRRHRRHAALHEALDDAARDA